MKTIKIIEIVKLIEEKNYENLPKKIKINNKTYEFDKTDNEYRRYDRGGSFTPLYEFMKNRGIEYFSELIQMEAEIIEEEKEIEPLVKLGNYKVVNTGDDFLDKVLTNINERINHLIDKQTEIIDAVNEIRKEK